MSKPEFRTPELSADAALAQVIDQASATVTYVGEAKPGAALADAVWRIQRITTSGSLTRVEWAGTGDFGHPWDGRAGLAYT